MEETMQAHPADATQQTKYVSLKEQMAFNFSAFLRDMIYSLKNMISYYFIDVLGLSGFQMWLLIGFEKIWDGINDPIMGAYFDRRPFKGEKARRFFKTTGLPAAVTFVLMFLAIPFSADPAVNGWMRTGFILLLSIPFSLLLTLNGTSCMSYYNSITPNIQERSGIISRARLFSTMGSAVIAGGVPLLLGFFDPSDVYAKKMTYAWTAVGVGSVFVLYNMLMYTQVKERIVSPPQEQQSIRGIFRGMLQNRLFFILMISNAIGGLINAGNTGMWFYTYNIGNPAWQTWIGLAGLPSLLVATWLIPRLSERFEKRNIVIACGIAQILLNLLYLAVGYKSLPFLFFNSFISALPSSIRGPLYWSMIADSVDYLEHRTGKRNDGTIYAMEGLMGKIVGGFGSVSTALIIRLIRFVPNAESQSPETLRGLFVVPVVIGMISTALSLIPYFFYDLTRKGHAKIIEELKERAGAEKIPS
jgi:Na+/melibiose symporter-like transporter